jgi:hypothetical protein
MMHNRPSHVTDKVMNFLTPGKVGDLDFAVGIISLFQGMPI